MSKLREHLSAWVLRPAVLAAVGALALGLFLHGVSDAAPPHKPLLLTDREARARVAEFLGRNVGNASEAPRRDGTQLEFTLESREHCTVELSGGAVTFWGGGQKNAAIQRVLAPQGATGQRSKQEAVEIARRLAKRAIPGFDRRHFEVTKVIRAGNGCLDVELRERLANGAHHGRIHVRVFEDRKMGAVDGMFAGSLEPVSMPTVTITLKEARRRTPAAVHGEPWVRMVYGDLTTAPRGQTVSLVRGPSDVAVRRRRPRMSRRLES